MANITKRGNSYRIRVFVGEEPNGEKRFKTTTWKPPREGMTKRQIDRALTEYVIGFEKRVYDGELAETYKTTLAEFCDFYLSHKKTLSPLTLEMYKSLIEKKIKPYFGFKKLKDIKTPHVQGFIDYLQKPNEKGKTVSASTVHREFQVLQSIFSLAYKLGYIDKLPTEKRRLELPICEEEQIEVFDKDEVIELLRCLEKEPLMFQVLIHLAIVTGCRRGELVALQWDLIDLDEGIVTIKQSNYKRTGEVISTKSTKTNRSRQVAIPAYLCDMLRKYRAEQNADRLEQGTNWKAGNWLFTQWDGKPMHPTTPTKWFSKFQARNGIPHHKFHSLRHTSATLLLINDTDIKTVSSRLGHTKLSTTSRYTHFLKSADREAANVFSAISDQANAN